MPNQNNRYIHYIHQLNQIGIALSSEKNHELLLEKILKSAIELVNADGGTLYLATENKHLQFKILINQSLKLNSKNAEANTFILPPIPLYDSDGNPNKRNIAAYCFLENKTIHIPDAYEYEGFDFSGMKQADKKLNYKSKSFLVIPLRNHENKIVGILQMINAIDDHSGEIIPFSEEKITLAESLASQAAITLTQQQLIQAQKNLFEALIKLIAKTIDEKSKYTSKHCTRVPILTSMIADAAQQAKEGFFKDFHFTADEIEELRVAAWLHDCGKIVTPVHVVDKSTKLETISDRIEVIDLRIELLLRDLKIEFLEKMQKTPSTEEKNKLHREYEKDKQHLSDAREFLRKTNMGGEFLSDTDKERIIQLSEKQVIIDKNTQPLLSKQDIVNLSVSRGTLNDEDRQIINNHVAITRRMLSLLPYPEYLKRVPEIAGDHHEAINGKGYPRGLKGEAITIQARILAIADIFEALTAADRPYKPAKTLKETLEIMTNMKNNGHIDPDIFDLFLHSKVYLTYAKEYLNPEQIDVI